MQKRYVNQSNGLLELKREFEAEDNKDYKFDSIINNIVYGKKTES